MATHNKNPEPVDAVQWPAVASAWPDWLASAIISGTVSFSGEGQKTMHKNGVTQEVVCDWVIKASCGKIYPVADADFLAGYTPV